MANKHSTKTRYHQKIELVIDYIHQHIDEPLSFAKLAQIACLSEYHWHRVYTSMTGGETITRTIRRLRLNRAADDLINTNLSIAKIGQRAGYMNSDSFTRKFSEDIDISPISYRNRGQLLIQQSKNIKAFNKHLYNVEITTLDSITVATMDHQGDFSQITSVFARLESFARVNDLLDASTRTFGIYYDDPNIVEEKKRRSKACITVQKPIASHEGIDIVTIPKGRFAMITHKGPYSELEHVYRWFYNWLVNSEHEPGNHPMLEEYLNNPREIAPSELLTTTYLSIK